jgi:hypothetical protein
MNDRAREILATACDAVVVELAIRRCQKFLDEGLTLDQAAERMTMNFSRKRASGTNGRCEIST